MSYTIGGVPLSVLIVSEQFPLEDTIGQSQSKANILWAK